MKLTWQYLLQKAVETVRDPRGGARFIMGIQLDSRHRWEVLLLVVVVGTLLAQVSFLLAGTVGGSLVGPFQASPFSLGVIQAILLITMAWAVTFIGRLAGGSGSLDDAILLVAWLQFIMICLQIVQTFAMFVAPPVSVIIGIAGLVLFFWLLTNFVAEMHGFKSLTAIFVVIGISMIVFVFGLSILLGMLGIILPGVQ